MRLFLTGFMGSGKTTVARELAALADLEMVDLDREIERDRGLTVAEIFERDGEQGFRSLERAALGRVAAREAVVVATGGGTVCSPQNAATVRHAGVTVWLRPPVETLLDRLASEAPGRRPLFRDRAQAERLYADRLEAYGRADLEVRVAPEESAAEVAARVWDLVREKA